MSSHDSSDIGMQRIIQELESLQLSDAMKGYFLELLKHMDNRNKEWAKVVKMWESYESGSSGSNKAMIEIMRNVQDTFMKDDDFLKHLYKGRPAPDQDKAAKDKDAAFERGTAIDLIEAASVSLITSASPMSAIIEQMRLRNDECAKLRKLCRDYELYSSNLDGSVLEILHKVQEVLNKDSEFFMNQRERHEEDMKTMNAKLDEMKKKLEQQTLDGY
ncbi:hypothetical protein KCU77_g885, partial [Aureobasidium melanogenum]